MDRPLIAWISSLSGRLLLAVAMVIAPTASAQTPSAPLPAASTRLESYAIPPAKQAEVVRWLETVDPSVSRRFAWDQRTGQLIVFATDDIHLKLAAFLEGKPLVAPVEVAKPQAAAEVKLTNATVDQVHARIEAVVRRPLPKTWDPAEQWLSFPVRMDSVGGVEIKANPNTGQVLISGEPNEAAAWAKVVAAIDRSAAGEGVTQLVATPSAQPAKVKAALAALAQPGEGAAPAVAAPTTAPTQATPNGGAASPRNGSQAAGSPEAGAGQILGPVQVEFVEGLDIIIVRGNDEDVARVMEIINQIESLSQTTAPAIEVLPLQHVDSVLMARLLNRVYEQVLGARTGAVNVTPLGKPNSLLLIGRPENVQMATELAKKLDQPVEAATRFEVYPLKHASAEQAAELVNNFLGERADMENDDTPTLIPKALVVADVRSNSLVVSAGPRDLAEIRELLAKIDVGTAAAVDEVRVFPLRNTLATELETVLETAINPPTGEGENASAGRSAALQFIAIDAETKRRLQSGVLSNVRVAADARANTLIVTAPSDSMELIAALIEQMDRSASAEAELKVFTIANGDATSLAEMLETLFGTTEGDTTEPGGFGAGGNGLVGLQLSVDQRTNSIIAAGTTEDLAVVEAILLRLDDSDVRERTTTVYRLKNSPAQDVATALNEWLQTERDVEQAADISISPFEQIEREVIVVPEIVSNSLIVSATPRYYEDVRELIEKLDERPPMVMIQVLIAEVRLNDTDEFGIELGLQDSVLFDRSLLSDVQTLTTTTQQQSAGGAVTNITEQRIIAANNNPGFSFNNNPLGNSASSSALATAATVGSQGLSNFALNRTNSELGFGGFVLSASSNSISMLLRALQENRRLEVLSRPQVMALDNQEGIVQVGQRVPRITQASLTQFGQTNSITYENVGIILRVIPRISPDGMVVMQVAAEKSEVGAEAEGIPISVANNGNILRAPRIDSTQAITTVSALSGQTVVLSGLMTKRTLDIHRRVPLLADIPLLGSLFRYDSVSEQRTELLIIMTPRIVKSELDAEMIKQVESSRMSWVLCDVINMHGPSGLRSRCDEWTGADAPTLYPTSVPTEQELQGQPVEGPIQGTVIEGPPIESSPGPLMEGVPTPAPMGPTSSTKRAGSVSQVNYQRPTADNKSDTVYRLPPTE